MLALRESVRAYSPDGIEQELVVFMLDGQRYALPLDSVQRVVRVVAITPLSDAPSIIIGVIDLEGTLVPVVNMRSRCGHPGRDMRLSDHFVVASTGRRTVALLVDETLGVISQSVAATVPADEILPSLELTAGAVKLEDGLILIHDLGRLLSLDEEAAIGRALHVARRSDR